MIFFNLLIFFVFNLIIVPFHFYTVFSILVIILVDIHILLIDIIVFVYGTIFVLLYNVCQQLLTIRSNIGPTHFFFLMKPHSLGWCEYTWSRNCELYYVTIYVLSIKSFVSISCYYVTTKQFIWLFLFVQTILYKSTFNSIYLGSLIENSTN